MLKAYHDHWALVTGASSGIGAEFARQLAGRGMHLVLTARRRDKLEQLAQELHTRHGTKTEIIAADLGQPGETARLHGEVARRGVTIELLVNNAGFGLVSEVAATDLNRVRELLRVNIEALTELTYAYLPGMLERKHGGIINVSSVAAFQPVAYMSAYAGSKAYVLHFSEGLWAEAQPHGVTVLALCPGTTRTDFFDVAGASNWLRNRSAQTVDQVVRAGLKGLDKGRQYVVSGTGNYILSLLVRLADRRTVVRESRKYFRPKKAVVESENTPADDTTHATTE